MNYFHQMLVSNELGGAGVVALHLANFLRSRSQESHVWIPGAGPALRRAEELCLPCHTYKATSIFSPSKINGIVANWQVGRNLHRHSPGIIHIHSPFYYRALRLGAMISGLKCVVHVHLEEDEEGLRWAFKSPPHLIITCARFLVEYVQRTLPQQYQERQRIVAVSNPVDTGQFCPGDKVAAKRRVGAPAGTSLVLMLANLAPHKGQETAIRASATLKKAGVNIVLWLAGIERGGGERYTTHLRSLASELGVSDRIHFLGHRNDAPELLRAADLFLLPSTREGLPLTILEAQATKVPVLAAPTGGIPEVVINDETGFLIASEDVAGYAKLINSLLDNPDLGYRIVKQAYARVMKEYCWEVYSERIWELYRALMTPSYRTLHPKRKLL